MAEHPNWLTAPFPWFGGKSKAAAVVWAALGEPKNYVEPFAGSLAVLLGRPSPGKVETVNDADGFVANFWRAVQADPDAVALHADHPVNEADLHARHLWLCENREDLTARLCGDPDYYDAKVAGWWVWGQCLWIGSGWCSGNDGPWQSIDGRMVKVGKGGKPSVSRQIPHLGDDGRGVHKPSVSRKRPHLGDDGRGVHRPWWAERGCSTLHQWFSALQTRLRCVRVCVGDWSRVMGRAVTHHHLSVRNGASVCGVFLDPPYSMDVRKKDLYAVDTAGIADAVCDWCVKNTGIDHLRIVLAGYDNEAHRDKLLSLGWTERSWKATGLLTGRYGNKTSMLRERLWCSPTCLDTDNTEVSESAQVTLESVK